MFQIPLSGPAGVDLCRQIILFDLAGLEGLI